MTWVRWRKTWHLLALHDSEGYWGECGYGSGNRKVTTSEDPADTYRCKLCIRYAGNTKRTEQ